jgi:hypothetical protein
MNPVDRAWLVLLALCAGSTGLALAVGAAPAGPMIPALGVAILGLAWAKARIVLALYLGLAAAPSWLRGFELILALYAALLLALYLAG